jgi:hypothetical protein
MYKSEKKYIDNLISDLIKLYMSKTIKMESKLIFLDKILYRLRMIYKEDKTLFSDNQIQKIKEFSEKIKYPKKSKVQITSMDIYELVKKFPKRGRGRARSNSKKISSRNFVNKINYRSVRKSLPEVRLKKPIISENRNPNLYKSLNSNHHDTFLPKDNFKKQFIDEGIAGSRKDNIRMRGALRSDFLKRIKD